MIWTDVIFLKENTTTDELNNTLPDGTYTKIAQTACRRYDPYNPETVYTNERMEKEKEETAFKVRSGIDVESATHFRADNKLYKIIKTEDVFPRWWIVFGRKYA